MPPTTPTTPAPPTSPAKPSPPTARPTGVCCLADRGRAYTGTDVSTASSLEAIKTLLAAHGAEQVRTSEDLRQRLVAIEWVRWVLVDGQRQPQPYRVSVAVQELRHTDAGWVGDKDQIGRASCRER